MNAQNHLFLAKNILIQNDDDVTPRIVGGRNVTIENFPFQASLFNRNNNQHFCGAAIIGRYTLLTSASCIAFHAGQTHNIAARVGSASRTRGGDTRQIRRIINHPNFNATTFDNDIALLTLYRRISYSRRARSIALAPLRLDLPTNETITVSGWGRQQTGNGPFSEVLQAVDLQIVDQRQCQNAYRTAPRQPNIISPNMLCAGAVQGGRGPCEVSFELMSQMEMRD